MMANILLVEDEPTNAMVVKWIVERYFINHSLYHASSGKEAFELLSYITFDLIFMDIYMPDMSGYETTMMIRNYLELTKVPIIALTSVEMNPDSLDFLNKGFNGYIPKPLNNETFKNLVVDYIGK